MKKSNNQPTNNPHGKPIVVAEKNSTLREKFKTKLKEYIRKKMTEISTSGAAGGGGGDGSAGPVKTPHAFGKTSKSSAEKSMPGGKVVGSLDEKESTNKDTNKDSKKPAEAPPKKYEPIVKPKELDPKTRLKKMDTIKTALNNANKELDSLYKSRKKSIESPAASTEENV